MYSLGGRTAYDLRGRLHLPATTTHREMLALNSITETLSHLGAVFIVEHIKGKCLFF